MSLSIGFALTGSFCTLGKALQAMQELVQAGYEVTPVFSEHISLLDTRFGAADEWRKRIREITPFPAIDSIPAAEPIGPQKLFDLLLVAPCTGNTLGKLAGNIVDNTVTLAVKSHLRTARPVVLAISTNDALSGSAANLGLLLNRRFFYFVPFRQDAPEQKPCSLVADFTKVLPAVQSALSGRQLQPLLLAPG